MKIPAQLQAMRYKLLYEGLNYMNRHNSAVNAYKEEGLSLLRERIDTLPDKIAFRPKCFKQSFCAKIYDESYIFISKANLSKPIDTKFDSFFHEVGHWLHFQNLPSREQRVNIWSGADKEKIRQEVSEYSIKKDDGLEFIPEVFKGLMKGKTFSEYVMNLFNSLGGPNIKR